jgi:hypothetical protein
LDLTSSRRCRTTPTIHWSATKTRNG